MLIKYKDYDLSNDDLATLGKVCTVCSKIKKCPFIKLDTPFCKTHRFILMVAYKKYKKQLKE